MDLQEVKKQRILYRLVLETLVEKPYTRQNDVVLVLEVLERCNVNIRASLVSLALSGELNSWESITRARRKIQVKFPELRDERVARQRVAKETTIREYYKNLDKELIQ